MPQVVTRAGALTAVCALLSVLGGPAALAGTDTIVRQHLDAGRVQFSGMDINGDEIPDSIRLDRIKQTLAYFVGDDRRNQRSFDPATLPEEDRRFVSDVLLDKDLDGDEIADLLLYNRDYLTRFSANEPVLLRILAAGVYIGQPRGVYVVLSASGLTEEARRLVLDRARRLALPGP